MEYVVGFMFDKTARRVLLIRKTKPDWQRGKLNGVGGKIEPGESPIAAMVREFKEETGIETTRRDWTQTVILSGNYYDRNCWKVYFFCARGDISRAVATTDEIPRPCSVEGLHVLPCIPNVRWLVPMQLHPVEWPIEIRERRQ